MNGRGFPLVEEPVSELVIDHEPDPLPVDESGSVSVTATYANGTERDVTADANISIDNESVASIDHDSVVGQVAGETTVNASYLGANTSTPVSVEAPEDGLSGPPVVLVVLALAVGTALLTRLER